MKKKTLLYRILKKVRHDYVKGLKLVVQQKEFKGWKYVFIPIWKKKILILWKPNLQKYPHIVRHHKNIENLWFIMNKDFEVYNPKTVKIKHICENKKLLKKLTNIIT